MNKIGLVSRWGELLKIDWKQVRDEMNALKPGELKEQAMVVPKPTVARRISSASDVLWTDLEKRS